MYGLGILFFLLLNVQSAAAQAEVCYILDGILVIYGIVLTILYCRLRIRSRNSEKGAEAKDEGIYQGLKPHASDTYETLQTMKKPVK
ncbi:Fc receptor, IgE, high affinity I, gamma polypeptide like isoform X1 [Electrophorus electricus]|uniref:Fc-epsilon RI-gamma n=1 Tax=Electrophorus electricus TaxID=8005 RepID=A0AAY5EYR0_ELEEL|nr:Fc receptor, IgE, high affinity I, gamma polypeptide like isoform X1 [Electrophorus electricus]